MTSVASPPILRPGVARISRTPGHQSLRRIMGVGDVVVVAAAAVAVALLWSVVADRSITDAPEVAVLTVSTPAAWLVAAALTRAARLRSAGSAVDELASVFRTGALAVAGLCVVAVGCGMQVPRWWFASAGVATTGAVVVLRMAVRSWLRLDHRRQWAEQPVLVVGAGPQGQAVVRSFRDEPECRLRAVGYVDDDLPPGTEIDGVAVVGPVSGAVVEAEARGVAGLVLTGGLAHDRIAWLVRASLAAGLDVQLCSQLQDVRCTRLVPQPAGRQPLVGVEAAPRRGWRMAAKRALDVTVAGSALVFLAPLLLVAMVLVKWDSPGPAVFRQRRVGQDGVPFTIFKLRTMVVDAEARRAELLARNEADGPLFKLADDPRVTRVGRVLRKLSIDELPQLVNVVLGHMSLVGPRPALPSEVDEWPPELHDRLRVRPGITGLWQVSGRSDCSFDDYARYDLYYVDNWSLATDLAILVRTVPIVLWGNGAR